MILARIAAALGKSSLLEQAGDVVMSSNSPRLRLGSDAISRMKENVPDETLLSSPDTLDSSHALVPA